MKLIEILKENRLMQTAQEVDAFETALAELAKNPDENNLTAYHLILDDRCQQPEVMFSLIHFLESFEMEKQIEAFITIIPQLMIAAPEWTRILHDRILNDESAGQVYQKLLHSINSQKPNFLYYLLEESVRNHIKNEPSDALTGELTPFFPWNPKRWHS
jgi:hypothetical protein